MNRLRGTMQALSAEGRQALVVYLTYGDPSPELSVDVLLAAAEAGADVIELGVPFSDPSADGVVIQQAMERALAAGATMDGALSCVAELRKRGCETPVVLFGYYNPIFVMGAERFAQRAKDAGIDAVLTVDLPMDELGELYEPLSAANIAVVPLVAPTSTDARIEAVSAFEPAFVYYISMTGVTGGAIEERGGDPSERIASVRDKTKAPVCVGFGIRSAADAARVAAFADGVVVGSEIIRRLHDAGPAAAAQAVSVFVAELRAGVDSARSAD